MTMNLGKTFDIQPYGASCRIEYMGIPSKIGVSGFGVNVSWNPMKTSTQTYTLESNMITASIFFVKKGRLPKTRFLMELICASMWCGRF